MRKTKRSAFTIVELVIVIAVIAILSAVLIPTFGAIIKNANVASDQSTAATLTTELHIYLKGETIDSEAELMAAINAIDPDGKKLVPKALNHDHHFWFDMENQMIVAGFTEDIKNKTSQSTSKIESQSGAVLTSAELIAETSSNTAFLGMRDVFNNGFFLIDSADALSSMFGDMSSITKDNYATFISTLDNTAKNNEVYGVIAEKVLENVAKTTIFTKGGVFYFSENTSDSFVFFADDVKVISNTHYVYDGSKVNTVTNGTLPAPKGALNLPSSVVLVEEDSLDFGDGNSVVINTTLADANAIANVFSPLASDATIKDKAGVSYKIVHLDTLPEGDTHEKDRLVLASDNTTWMADLIVKLPFEDYTIGYTEEDSLVEFNTDTLYVSNLKSDDVVLFAKDTKSDATSLSVFKWESDNAAITVQGGVLSFDEDAILAGSHRATITATAKNINGENIVRTLKVEVRIVESATVKIGDYDYPLGQGAQHLSYVRDGNNQSIELVPTIGWKSVTGETLYDLRDGEMTITKADETKTTDGKVAFAVGESEYTFTVSIDGRLETEFTVAIVDIENSPFKLKFHHARNYSPYYVGSGDSIKLSDLFYTNDGFTFNGATLTVYGYAERGTDLFTVNEINNYAPDGQAIWTDEYTSNITSNWGDVEIQFNTDSGYDHTDEDGKIGDYDVVIEIAPKNDLAMIVHIVVVADATNASNVAELTAAHSSSVILHNDVSMTSGQTVALPAGAGFYGNGYVISATTYQSGSTDANYLDSAIVSVNGGVVENAYINGPTYAVLDYTSNANKNFVSGIHATGESTITNSYIYGFRQPVMATGDKLSVINSTLEGGNMGNLYLENGDLYLEDVTTVQKLDGYQTTVGESKKVIGAGIHIGKENVDAKITIVGYLDQYNWIKNQQNGPSMPTVYENSKEFDLGELFGFIFNGIEFMGFEVDMGSVKYFINQDTTMTSNRTDGYVHTGIVFYDMGSESAMDTFQNSVSITVNEDARTDGTIKMRKFDLLPMRFSDMGVKYTYNWFGSTKEIGFDGADYFGTDGYMLVWSHKDNRAWSAQSMSSLLTNGTRYVNPSGGKVDSTKPIIQIGDNTDYKITYSGYTYGE